MGRLESLTAPEFEELCDGCGKCCESDHTGVACPSLDTTTNRCMNYSTRLNHHYAMCSKVTASNTLFLHRDGRLPDSCAYVRFELGQPPLTRPVEAAKLIPFIIAGPKHIEKYERARKLWDKMKKGTPDAKC